MTFEIFAVILGDSPASEHMFSIIADGGTSVSTWKKSVLAARQNRLKGHDEANLTIWVLDNAILSAEVDDKVTALAVSQNLSEVAVKMVPADYLSDYFSEPPPKRSLHVLVVLPSSTLKRKRGDSDGRESIKKRRLVLLPQSLTVFKTEADLENPNDPLHLPTRGGGFLDMTSLYNFIAVDKTKYIELLDKEPKYQYMFLRPRRWGKSTFLQTLVRYYDKTRKDSFRDTFRDLYIGKNPTSARHSLLILQFNFSEISGTNTLEVMKREFDRTITCELVRFLKRNEAFLGGLRLDLVNGADGIGSLKKVLNLVGEQGERLFVGVDEYDAPASTVIFDKEDDSDRYQVVAEFFKTSFFAVMKLATSTVVDKYWITGVLPVFRDGISPLNAIQIISDQPGYNGLCGLTDTEVREIAQCYLSSSNHQRGPDAVLKELKRWYSGYLFCPRKNGPSVDTLYNPQLVFEHLRGVADKEVRLAPLEEIGSIHTSSVLEVIPDTGEASYFGTYLSMIANTVRMEVAQKFGAAEVRRRGHDPSMIWTLLYFLGVLTYSEDGRHLKVPNVTMINVITRRFSNFLIKRPEMISESIQAYSGLFKGNVEPLIKFLESFFGSQPAGAVKDCNEPALRTALAAFWSNPPDKSLLELSLLVEPTALPGNGRSGFLDMFLPSSGSASCIELKNIRLEALWKGEVGDTPLSSDTPLEVLRAKLCEETVNQLLERKFRYDTGKKLVKDVKKEAFEQIKHYLNVMKNGKVSPDCLGVNDWRIQHSENACELVGYVVILLGGTRALGWQVTTVQTEVQWQIKDVGYVSLIL